ncbi:hypothetical protein U5N54_14040 [Bacillus paralicheniformis]|uniref:hypothetical protein n=1 Tax=Bacillus paralicheniformis TaxID=1648923 RepID=UPI00397881BC
MKKFTELERNLIKVILDDRCSDYKKEQDFKKVFGIDANIDLEGGRSYLLDDALFFDLKYPEVVRNLLDETNRGDIDYDVMIDALEAAINDDWGNVPSVEQAVEFTGYLRYEASRKKEVLREFFESVYVLHDKAEENGVDLQGEIRQIEETVLSSIGISNEAFSAVMGEYLGGLQTIDEIVESSYVLCDWNKSIDFDSFLTSVLESIKTLAVKGEQKGIDLLFEVKGIESLPFYLVNIHEGAHDRLDKEITEFYERELPLGDLLSMLKDAAFK